MYCILRTEFVSTNVSIRCFPTFFLTWPIMVLVKATWPTSTILLRVGYVMVASIYLVVNQTRYSEAAIYSKIHFSERLAAEHNNQFLDS